MFITSFCKPIKKIFSLFLPLFLLLGSIPIVYSSASAEYEPIPIDEYILVGMAHEYSFPEKGYSPEYFDSEKVERVETISSYHEGDLKDRDSFNRIEKLYLSENGKKNLDTLIKELNNRTDVFIAEQDYEYQDGLAMVTPNDDFFDSQYALTNIMAQKAWAFTKGTLNMRVGIIDSGISSTHPDLSSNVSTSLSKNYVENTSGIDDLNGHGTNVAGILGARGDNTIGISGICWNVKMISLRVSDSSGNWTNARVISAIEYASANNISILNMSIQNGTYCPLLENKIANYTGLCVVAAGNITTTDTNATNIRYPALYHLSNMIVVTATRNNDNIGPNSKFHQTYVDLGAPGTGVYTTIINSPYYSNIYMTGTSLAAPYVSGTLALMRTVNINLTSSQLKSILLSSVDPVSWLSDKVSTGGRLNTFRAVRKAKGYKMGDADLDGSITSEDSRQVLRWSVQLDPVTDLKEALCDVDYSNSLTAFDARQILRISVGLDPEIE